MNMPEEDSESGGQGSPETTDEKDTNNSNQQTSEDHSNMSNSSTVQLSVRSLVIGVFVMGVAIGFSGGIMTGSGTSLIGTDSADNMDVEDPTPQPSDTGSDNTGQDDTNDQNDGNSINMDDIDLEGEPVLGQEDAPVTMVVYEDFECPFCKRFEEGAVKQIESNYVDSGQVKVVWKDRPLTQLHPWAEPAAAAAECVYREGGDEAFWNVKDKVFANQESIETSNVESKIKSWASEEGVSESAVQSCIDNDNPMEEVNADSTEGEELGASGTPTAFIDGRKIVGAQPFSNFEPVIEAALG